jgi:hypothetical protein
MDFCDRPDGVGTTELAMLDTTRPRRPSPTVDMEAL